MAIPVSGVPDQNAKPSLVLFDSGASVSFAWDGSSTLGAAYVQIVDNSGVPIVSFGGGTQYTDAGTPPTHPIGTMPIWNNGGTWSETSLANGLPVQPATGASFAVTGTFWQATQPVSGTVTANAGTNLNTSALLTQSDFDTKWAAGLGVTGTFWQATQPISAASGSFASGSIADGAMVTLGTKADAKSTATDTTAVTIMQVLKQISASVQAPPSQAVTNAGTFAVQNTESTTLPSFTTAPDSVAIAASSSGDNTLISAPGVGKTIYVYAYSISFNGTVNAKLTDGAAGTNKAGLFYGVANAGAANSVRPPYYLFKCSSNTALVLNLSGAVAVGGHISYFVI